ncbi:MAG TPA: hypothetical protein VIO16_02305 [Dehalococcoidia bacterium]
MALLVAALIAVALGSYLSLNLTSTRLAKRSFSGSAAFNLAEAGAEEAVWSFNRVAGGDLEAWSAWSNNGSAAWQKFSNFNFGQNLSGSVKVYVDSYNPPTSVRPKIIAFASIDQAGEAPVTKMLEVILRRRSYFANGLVAKNSLVFNGANTSIDSWDSDPDGDATTAPIPYDATVRRDQGSIASTAVLNAAVAVNQANVWGYVATGGGQPQVGAQGSVRGADTPADVMIDPRRISTDFNAEFTLLTAPVDGTPIATVGATLGTLGAATRWRCSSISLNGSQTLTILGDVTLILTAGSGAQAIEVTGNATILIPAGSSLTVYAEGDMKIAGGGLGNSNIQPVSCQFWGTNQSVAGQNLRVAGNGALRCVVYAPNAAVEIDGNGDVMGSIIARDITLTGNAMFHYDEALARYGIATPFGIAKWRELSSAADRAAYLSVFSGW